MEAALDHPSVNISRQLLTRHSSPWRIRQMTIIPIIINLITRRFVKRAQLFRFFFLAPIPYADFVRKTEVDVAKLDLNFYNSRHHICTAGTAEQMNEINQRQIFSLLPCLCCSIVPSFIGDIVVIWSNWCVLWFKISNKCVFKLRENLKSRIYHLKIL